jgi:sterol desaturase/sphingolipid hydroxylase (fatty acid hydroxylase superfamily)
MWLAYANGFVPILAFSDNPVWFVLLFPLIAVWQAFHFYCIHRFLHLKPLYDRFHSVHHRNVTIGPWSGFSMHPVEHLLYLSSLFVMLVVPSHPLHMLFLAFWLSIATATSHSGYQELIVSNFRTTISAFHHQLHHRYFNCNYGNIDMPLDQWFGSFNDGTSAATKRLLRR